MDAIARRMGPHIVETYPLERYPMDNAAGVAALRLHDRLTGEDHGGVLDQTRTAIAAAVDPSSGLLHQAVNARGTVVAHPRGSGTFLAAWFLHRDEPALAQDLFRAGRTNLRGSMLGITAMREYLKGVDAEGDVDSGPLIYGFSVSSTGFALGCATALGDDALRDDLRETVAWGTPVAMEMVPGLQTEADQGATGSALGDALMLAMLTSEGRP